MNKTTFAALALGLSGAAFAATPDGGTLTDNGEALEWSGGPFAAANASGSSLLGLGEPTCAEVVLPCDDFALTVELTEEFIEQYPSAVVRIFIAMDDTGPTDGSNEDYDLFVYDDSGQRVGASTSEGATEVVALLASPGTQEFLVRTVPWATTGSSYKGKVELIPGEPAFLPEEGGEEEEGEGFTGLKSGSASAGSSVGGSGSLGLGLLVLFGIAGLRRRG